MVTVTPAAELGRVDRRHGRRAFIGGPVLYVRKGPFTMTLFAGGPATQVQARAKLLKLGPIAAGRM